MKKTVKDLSLLVKNEVDKATYNKSINIMRRLENLASSAGKDEFTEKIEKNQLTIVDLLKLY
jgi:hypothetical protein